MDLSKAGEFSETCEGADFFLRFPTEAVVWTGLPEALSAAPGAAAVAAAVAGGSEVADAAVAGEPAEEAEAEGSVAGEVADGDVEAASSSRCLISAALLSSASRCDSLLDSFTFLRPAISVANCLSYSLRSAANRLNMRSPRSGSYPKNSRACSH